MDAANTPPVAWNHEQAEQAETVDQLIKRAHHNLAESGVIVSPSKVSRVIRQYVRNFGVASTSSIVDGLFRPALPSAAEALWYEISVINNLHVEIPGSYRALPPISRMRLDREAI